VKIANLGPLGCRITFALSLEASLILHNSNTFSRNNMRQAGNTTDTRTNCVLDMPRVNL